MDGPVIASAHEVVTQQHGIGAETAMALIGACVISRSLASS